MEESLYKIAFGKCMRNKWVELNKGGAEPMVVRKVGGPKDPSPHSPHIHFFFIPGCGVLRSQIPGSPTAQCGVCRRRVAESTEAGGERPCGRVGGKNLDRAAAKNPVDQEVLASTTVGMA